MYMKIIFQRKLSSIQLEDILPKFQLSLSETNIEFDLSRLEWVSVEAVTFLFGWIRLINKNSLTKITVTLPDSGNRSEDQAIVESEVQSRIKNGTLNVLNIQQERDRLQKKIRDRRGRMLNSLWDIWKIEKSCNAGGLEKVVFENPSGSNYHFGKNYTTNKFQLVPFFHYAFTDFIDNLFMKIFRNQSKSLFSPVSKQRGLLKK